LKSTTFVVELVLKRARQSAARFCMIVREPAFNGFRKSMMRREHDAENVMLSFERSAAIRQLDATGKVPVT
jgi:hypothetical protein